MELCTHEKAVFFLPVNILTVWLLTFLATRHTTICLDYIGETTKLKEIQNVILFCATFHLGDQAEN